MLAESSALFPAGKIGIVDDRLPGVRFAMKPSRQPDKTGRTVSLKVVSFATYRTSVSDWRGIDYDAHDFVSIIKGRSIAEYGWIKVRGQFRRFDNGNRDDVIAWFGEMVSDYFASTELKVLPSWFLSPRVRLLSHRAPVIARPSWP